jgi:hypothetical protein
MMTSSVSFDEKAFIEFMIDRFYHDESDEPCEILYDNYFKLYFPTDEIREEIRSKYYSGGEDGFITLYHILLNKVQNVLLNEDEVDDDDEMDAYELEAMV